MDNDQSRPPARFQPAATLASPPLPPGTLTHADTDARLVRLWLQRPNLSPRTIRAADKEAHRFLLWCGSHGLQLRTVYYEHLLAYANFINQPAPADQWVAAAKYPRTDPRWRPFLGPLSEPSQRQALVILKGLFGWARAAGYLAHNPAKLLGNLALSGEEAVSRFLPSPAIPLLLAAVEQLPSDRPGEAIRKARARFIILAYYHSAARLNELVQANMRSIARERDGRWWLHVIGKGRKRGKVPVTDQLLAEYQSYRQALGLTALPHHDEALPLLLASRGPQRRASHYTVARAIKLVMKHAAALANADGNPELARRIEQASTHWLRHSSLTHQLDAGMPLPTVQRNARHTHIKTTGRYLHKEDAARHNETQDAWAKLHTEGDYSN
jgi:site-specific recombinase XerD